MLDSFYIKLITIVYIISTKQNSKYKYTKYEVIRKIMSVFLFLSLKCNVCLI